MVDSLVPHRLLNQKRIKEEDYISKAPGPWPLEENKFFIELRGALEEIPLL